MMDMTSRTPENAVEPAGRPPQYLGYSILMAFIAPLFGYFALFHSWRLGVLYERGDLAGAQRQSKLAKSWLRFAVVMFFVVVIVFVVTGIFSAHSGGHNHMYFY
jgi:hypothetical protein